MGHRRIQIIGILWTLAYAVFIVWLYATEPRTLTAVATEASVAAGTYEIDAARFAAGLDLFRQQQYRAARDEWAQADPAERDARTQFYIAYAFYREGWGRLYNDDSLFRQGLAAAERAGNLVLDQNSGVAAPFVADDPELRIHTIAELKAELQQGLEKTLDDLNPLKTLRERK